MRSYNVSVCVCHSQIHLGLFSPSEQGRVSTFTSFAQPLPGETLAYPEKNVLGVALADELPACHKSSSRFPIINVHLQWHCERGACHAPTEAQMWSFFFSRYPMPCNSVFNRWVKFKETLFISPVKLFFFSSFSFFFFCGFEIEVTRK